MVMTDVRQYVSFLGVMKNLLSNVTFGSLGDRTCKRMYPTGLSPQALLVTQNSLKGHPLRAIVSSDDQSHMGQYRSLQGFLDLQKAIPLTYHKHQGFCGAGYKHQT